MKFRDALLRALDTSGDSLRSVAEATGVSYEQLKKVKQGKSQSTNVDDAVLVANHFKLSLDEFLGDDTQAKRDAVLDLYKSLSASEIEILLAAARGRDASRREAG